MTVDYRDLSDYEGDYSNYRRLAIAYITQELGCRYEQALVVFEEGAIGCREDTFCITWDIVNSIEFITSYISAGIIGGNNGKS